MYAFFLTIEDATGTIKVIFYSEDAVCFFNGLQPVNLLTNPQALAQVRRGIEALEQSPELTEFCIQSYSVKGLGELRYRVFDTFF